MLQNVFSWTRLTLFRPWFLTIVYPYWLGWLPRLSTVDHFHRRGSSQAKRRKRRADSFPENVDFRRILLTLHLFWFCNNLRILLNLLTQNDYFFNRNLHATRGDIWRCTEIVVPLQCIEMHCEWRLRLSIARASSALHSPCTSLAVYLGETSPTALPEGRELR